MAIQLRTPIRVFCAHQFFTADFNERRSPIVLYCTWYHITSKGTRTTISQPRTPYYVLLDYDFPFYCTSAGQLFFFFPVCTASVFINRIPRGARARYTFVCVINHASWICKRFFFFSPAGWYNIWYVDWMVNPWQKSFLFGVFYYLFG